jgi:hypothetical protein
MSGARGDVPLRAFLIGQEVDKVVVSHD